MGGFSISDALNSYVEKLEEERPPDGFWHPSAISGCERAAVYKQRQVAARPFSPRTKRIFRQGHTVHSFVQAAVEDAGEAYTEVAVYHPLLKIKGAADQLVPMGDGTMELQEYKSAGAYSFKAIVKSGVPKPEHVIQAGCYWLPLRDYGGTWGHCDGTEPVGDDDGMCPNCVTPWKCNGPHEVELAHEPRTHYMTLPPLGAALKQARITVINKDDLETAEFVVQLDDELEAEVRGRVLFLEQFREGRELPDRLDGWDLPEAKRPFACRYCDHYTTCASDDANAQKETA